MEINYEFLDKMLNDLLYTDIITIKAKEDLAKFVKTHNINDISDETSKEMFGIYKITLKPAYEAVVGSYLPNIFAKEGVDYGDQEQ